MSTQFPTQIDAYTNPGAGQPMNSPGVEHDVLHSNIQDAMVAVQTVIGVAGTADTNSIQFKVAALVAMLLSPNGQVRIQVVNSQAQLQLYDAGFGKYVPIVSNNGILATGSPIS